MIGFFLVLVSVICAMCRGLGKRVTELVYKRRLGLNFVVSAGQCEVLFLQYFIRGREFWYWSECGADTCPSDLEDMLLIQQPRPGLPKVESAWLRTASCYSDVTKMIQQLAGPEQDFYGRRTELLTTGSPILQAYLNQRIFDPARITNRWVACYIRLFPGSAWPFKPTEIVFDKRSNW